MPLDQSALNEAADLLLSCRRDMTKTDALPDSAAGITIPEGYEVQKLVIDGLGGPRAGFKIGCTGNAARQLLGLDHPFYGVIPESGVSASPSSLDADSLHMRVIEPEFALRIGQDLGPKDGEYTAADIEAAIDAIRPCIEVVNSQYTDWTGVGAPSLAADNGAHGLWVTGEIVEDWRGLDFDNHAVTLSVNGAVKETGSGAAVLTGVFGVTAWLANALIENGLSLKKGDWISTGTTTPVYPAQKGDQISADFGSLGKVEVSF